MGGVVFGYPLPRPDVRPTTDVEATSTPAATPDEAGSAAPSAADVAGAVPVDRRGWVAVGDPLTVDQMRERFPYVDRVNPDRSLLNCVFAAIVTDLLVHSGGRGRFEAPTSVATEVGVLGFYAGRPVQEVDGYQAVVDAMSASRPGSRGVMVVNAATGSVAHAVNVVRTEHGVFFLDGQTNAPATVPPDPSRVRFVATTADVPAPAVPAAPTPVVDSDDLAGSDHAALFGLQPLGGRPRDLVAAMLAAADLQQEPGPVAHRWGTTDPGRLADGLELRLVVVGEDGALRAYGTPGQPEAYVARSGAGYLPLTPTAGREPELPGDGDVEAIGRSQGLTTPDGGEPVRTVASDLLDAHDGGLDRYRWTLDGHRVNLSTLLALPSVHRHLPRLLADGLVVRSDRTGPRAHRFELRLTGRRASGHDLGVDHLTSRVDVGVTLRRVGQVRGSTTREWQQMVTLTEQFRRTVPLLPLPPSGMPEPTGVPFPVTADQLHSGSVTVGAVRTPSDRARPGEFSDAVPLGFVRLGDHYRLVIRAVQNEGPVELLLDVTAVAELRDHFAGPGLEGLATYERPPGYAEPTRSLDQEPEGVEPAGWAALRDDPAVDLDRPRWDALTTLAPDVPAARLLSWIRAIGHTPGDLTALADRIGVAPRSLLTLAVDIGVDPRALTVFASRLVRLDAITVPELRDTLDPYGRITDDDVVAIADIAGRLGLDADALPALLDFVAYDVPFDLLTALPDTLLAAAMAVAWLRHDIDTRPDRAAEALGLDDSDQVEDLAMALGVLPGHLAVIAPEVRDAVLPDLDVPGSSGAPTAGRAEAVRENLRRSGYLPHDNAAGLTRQLTLAGRLGFHPGQLSFLLPSPHIVMLAHEFLVDVPLQRVELTLRLLAEDLTRPSEALLTGLPRTEVSDAELTEWADSLTSTDLVAEEFRASARALLDRPWGDLRGATALGYRAGSSELNRFLDVAQVAVASGRIPVDLLRIAHRLNLSADTVLVAARVIGTDPRYLHPFTAPLLRSELPASHPDHQSVADVAELLRTYAARRSPLHDESLRVPWMFRQAARGALGAWGAVVTPAVLATALGQLGRAEVPEFHTDALHDRGRQLSEARQRFADDLPADRIGALGDLGGLLNRWMAGLRQITGMHQAVDAAAPGSRDPLRNAVVARDRLERAIIHLLDAEARPTPELRAAWADRDQAVRDLTVEPPARLSRTLPGLLLAVLTADARYARLLSAAVAANLRQRPELREPDGTPHPAVAELAGAVESVGRTFEAILQDQPFFQRPDDLSALELDERLANALPDTHGSAVQGQRSGEAWLGTYWARRFADPRFDASTFALDHQARPWLDHGAVLALARAAGQPPWTVHRLVADDLERTPVELLDPANRHGVPLGRLLEYASRWYLDPAVFGFLDRAALADDDRHAEYAAQLEDHLNDRDSVVTALVLARATQGRFAGPPADTVLFDDPTAVVLSMGLPRAWGTGDPVPREALVEFAELEVSLIDLMDVQEPSIVLGAELGVPAMWVALVGTRVGRVPLDLAAHAARLGVADPLLLFALVAELGVDPAVFTSADGLRALNDPAPAEDRYAPVRALLTDPVTGPRLATAWTRPGSRVDPVPGGDRPPRPLPESVWQIYRTTGRVPTDIVRLAASAFLHPAVLADVAADLGMDPRVVSVLVQSLPDGPQRDLASTAPPAPRVDRAARVRDVAVEWTDRLERRWSVTADEIFSLFHFLRGEGHALTVLDNGSTAQVTDLLTQWRAERAARQGRPALTTPANSLDFDEAVNSADAGPGIRPIEDPPGLLDFLRAIPGVEVTDFADAAQADVAAQWEAAGGRTSDPADDSSDSDPSDSDASSTVDALTPARRSPAEPGAIGDPEGAARPRLPAGELVGRALPGLGRAGGRDPERLRQWVAAVEPDRPGEEVTLSETDCVVRAYAAFVALHGRSANVVDNRVAAAPESMTVRDLQELLNGSLRPLADWPALVDGLRATPGAMALIHLPANDLVLAPDAGPARGHVFWLWSDDRDGTPTLRVIDTQRGGLLADEAFTGAPDTRWERALTGHGVRALLLDADGRPATQFVPVSAGRLRTQSTPEVEGRPPTQSTPDRSAVDALTLASRSPAEPGVLGLPGTRHGTGSDAVAAALRLPDRHTGRDPDRLRGWVRMVEAQRQTASLEHDVARAYGVFVAMHGRSANVVDSRMSADAATLTLPQLQQLLGGQPRPVNNVRGMLTALRDAPGAMALVHVPDRERVFWLWSDDTGDNPALRVVDPAHPGSLALPAPGMLPQILGTPDVTVLALDADGQPAGPPSVDTLPPPAAATEDTTVPWYLQDGALGQFTVVAAGRPATTRTGSPAQIARSLVAGLPVIPGIATTDAAAIRAGVRREITRALTAPEHGSDPSDVAYEQYLEQWDERLTSGIHLSAGDRLVWILPVPREARPAPPTPKKDARVYKVSFGSTSREWTRDRERSSGSAFSPDTALSDFSRYLTRIIFQVPDVAFASHREQGSSESRKVVAGRQMFVNASTPFQAGLAFTVYVDGRLWATTATRPASDDLLLIQFPTPYTQPGNGRLDPARADVPVDLPAPRTSYADRVINALATEQLITSWHRALRESLDADEAVPFAEQGVAQLLNERTALNRNRRLLHGSDRVTGLHHGGKSMALHLMLQPVSLQHLGDAPDVAVRDDLGVIASTGTSADGAHKVAVTGEVASYGISHIPRPPATPGGKTPKDTRWQGTVGAGVSGSTGRDAGVQLGESVLNHTVFKRKSAQTRYRQQFEAVLVTRLSSGEVRPVVLLGMPGEVGVWQEQRGAYEQALLGAPMDGPIVAVPPAARRVGRLVDEEEIRNRLGPRAVEVLTGGRVVDPKTRRLMPFVETPQIRGRYPATPVPGEPLALAARRGLGPTAPVSLPGAEIVLDTAVDGLLTLSHREDLPVDVLADLEIHIGRDAMEADPSRFQTGDPFQVIIEGVPYDVLVLAYLEELRDTAAYPMDVNLRALQGSSVEGSVGTSSGVGGGFGGGVLVPLPLSDWKFQLGSAEIQGEWEWSRSDAYDGTIKHYRRTETTGGVTELRYRTIYEVVLRRAPTPDHAAGPRVTYLIGDEPTDPGEPDVAALRTVLPDEHRLESPVTPGELDLAGRVSNVTFREWDHADPIPYEKESAAGVFPFLTGLPEVAAQAAYAFQQLNNLDRRWFAEPLNWPRPLWGLGIASQAAGRLAEMTDGFGWLIALPDEGGHHQAVRVQVRAFNPEQTRAPSTVEIEHYQQFNAGHKWSHDAGRSVDVSMSGGPSIPVGGSGKDAARPGQDGPVGPDRPQIGGGGGGPVPGGDEGGRGRLSFGPSLGYRRSREDGVSDESGYIDITRATYGGLTQHHRSDLVFKITAERWDGEQGEVTRGVRYLRVNLGKDFITPDRLAAALGLPGATTVTPASPPARRPVDREPVRAWSHPERLTASTVLPAVTHALSAWKLLPRRANPAELPPNLLVRALTARLRPAALDGQFATLTGSGIRVWQPIVADGKIRFLLVQVTGDLQPPTADLPRDDVNLTERSEAVTAHSTETGHTGTLHVTGLARARGDIGPRADLVGELRAEWERTTGAVSGLTDETKDIMRLGMRQSHEFTHPVTFRVDIGLTTELPQLLRFLTTTGTNLYRALEGLVRRDAGSWSRWSADAPVVGRAAWWERTTTITDITADWRVLVPAYLTIPDVPSTATGPANGSWVPAGPSRPAARPSIRVERGPHPARPALNTAVLADPTFTPQTMRAVAEAAHAWAKLVTEPLRTWPDVFDEDNPPQIARKGDLSSLERAVAHHTSDRQLNRRFEDLLNHRYEVGDTGIRLGLDLRGSSFNVDLAPDGTVSPRGFAHKGRTYRQRDTKPSYEVSESTSSSVGAGAALSGTLGDARTGPGGSGTRGFGSGRGSGGEISNVGERNSERLTQYHLMRYDVTLVIYPPGNPGHRLLIDEDGALFAVTTVRPNIAYQPSARFAPTVDDPVQGMELGSRIDRVAPGRPALTAAPAARPIVPVRAAPPSRLDETDFRRTVDEVADAGQVASVRANLLSLAECLALAERMVNRLYPSATPELHALRPRRTQEADAAGSWLTGQSDWTPVTDWDAVVGELRGRPGSTAVVLLQRPNQTVHHMFLAHTLTDGRVLWADPGRVAGERVFDHPGRFADARLESAIAARTLVIGPDGTVAPGRSVPESSSTARAMVDAPLGHDVRGPVPRLGRPGNRRGTGSDAVAAALTLPDRDTGRDPGRLGDWVRTVEAQRQTASPQHDVARAYGAFVAMHGRAANVVDSRHSPDVVRLTLPELQQLLGGTVRPLTNVPGMLTALRNAPGAMALVHVPDRDRVFWLWSDETGDAPVLRVVDPTHAGLLDRSAPSVYHEMLRTPGVTVLALNADGRPGGEPAADPLPPPAATTHGTTVPWYLQDGALGQFTVLAAGRPASARVGSAAQIARAFVAGLPVLPDVPATDATAIRNEVRREITRALTAPERGAGPADSAYEQYLEHWDERLTSGIHLSAGKRLVWILPVARVPRPAPPAPEQDAKVYKVSFGSTSRGWTTDRERPSGGVSSWDTALGGISRHLTRVIFQLPDITFGSQREQGSSEGRKVLAGRQMFVTDSTPFQAGLAFTVYVDGRLWATTPTRPASDDLLLIQFPAPYTDPANGQYRPARAAASTDGSPPRTSYADRVINALSTRQLITSWHQALREGLDADAAADFARQGVAQLLNERTALNRNRRLLNGSDRATGLHHGSTTMSLHLMLQPMSLQHLGDTPDVAVRDDLGVIAEAGTSADGSRHVSLAGEVASYGISAIARALPKPGEKLPKDNRLQGTVSGELSGSVGRDAGVQLGESVLNHTVFKRTDAQTRYRQQFEAVLVTRLSSGEVRPVVLLGMPGEVSVWQEQRGAYEQALLGAPMDGPIVAVPPTPRRIGRLVDEEEVRNRLGPRAVEVLTGGRVVDPTTRRLMPAVETPQMRGRYPATPVPGEPLALATRRGLGPTAPLSLPGAEAVLDTATEGLLALSHRDELPVDAIEDLEIHIGRDAMEADPSRFQTGDPFQVIIDGIPYDVLVIAYVEELRDTSAYPMDVNLRALQGSSVEGSVGTSSGVGGGLGGGLLVPLPLQEWKLQLGRAELQGEWEWSQSDAYDGAVKHYRRTETTGGVTELRYRVIYEVVLRRAVTPDHAAGPRVTYLIGDEPTDPGEPDVAALRTVLPDEHRLDRTVTPGELDLAGRVTDTNFRAWNQANPIPYESESAAGVFPFLPGLPEVAAQAARAYAQLNNLDRRWFAEPLNWPRPLWGLGIASQAAGRLAEMTDGFGWLIALPDEGGHHQAVRVQVRAFNPEQTRAPSTVEIEHYQQFSAGHTWSHDSDRSVGVGISAGPVFPLGGSGKADDPTDRVAPSDPSRRQVGGIGSGGPLPGGDTAGEGGLGRLAFGPSGGYRWSREDGVSDESGYIDITRATYSGLTQHHRSDLVFRISAERWDSEQGEVTRAVRYLRVNLGKDFITPDRLAAALGLPGATTVSPASPPARRPVDREPVRAWSHPERLTARAVLPAVTRALSVWKLLPRRADPVDLPPTLLVRALTARLRPAALEGQFATLTGAGLRVWQPIVTDGTIRFLLVQVTGDLQPPTADLPRDDVALTERSEAVTAHSTDTAHSGTLHVGGRARARGEIASTADLAGEFRADWQRTTGAGSGLADETKDIMRLGIKQSHEFTQPITFRVDIGLTTELPELVRFLATTGTNLYRALQGLVLRDAGSWSRWSADAPVVGRAAWWQRTTAITGISGDGRLVVPAYLTIANAPSAANGPADGSWAPAGPSRPAAVPAVRVERGPHPAPPALNAAVLADPTFTPQSVRPIARAAHAWVKLVTEPLRTWPVTFDENHPPGIARKGHLSSLERTVAHHTSDRQLNRRFDELLEHRYRVGDTGIRLGLDLRGASFNVDLAPDGTVSPRGYTHKGRNYRQRDTKPSYEVSESTSSSVGGGATLRGTGGNVRTGPGGSGYRGFGGGRGYEGETSNVGERNSERRAQYHLMRYDATVVIYPPGDPGYRLLIDRDGGLFAVTTVRPDTTYQPPARFEATVVDPLQGMELGSRIDPVLPVQPAIVPVRAAAPTRLDESAFRRTVGEVADAGQAAAVRAGLLSLAECLALAERMVTRLYPSATPALHALRPSRTQEADAAGSWLTGQADWTPVTDWDAVVGDLRGRPGATAVVLLQRPNQTVHHMFLAHTVADGRVLWADPGRASGERVFDHPGRFADARLESAVAARTLVIGPDGTVVPGRAVPESSSTARAMVDAPLGHDVRGSVPPPATWRSELPTASAVVDLAAVRATLDDRAAAGDDPIPYRMGEVLPGADPSGLTLTLGTAGPVDLAGLSPRLADPAAVTAAPDGNGVTVHLSDTRDTWTDLRAVARHLRASGQQSVSATVEAALGPGDHGALAGLVTTYQAALTRMVGVTATTADALRASLARTSLNLGVLQAQIRLVHALRGAGAAAAPAWVGNHHYWWYDDEPVDVSGEARRLLEIIAAVLPDHADLAALALLAEGVNPGDTVLVGES